MEMEIDLCKVPQLINFIINYTSALALHAHVQAGYNNAKVRTALTCDSLTNDQLMCNFQKCSPMHGKLNRNREMVDTSDNSSNSYARKLDSDAREVLLLFPGKSHVRKFYSH